MVRDEGGLVEVIEHLPYCIVRRNGGQKFLTIGCLLFLSLALRYLTTKERTAGRCAPCVGKGDMVWVYQNQRV